MTDITTNVFVDLVLVCVCGAGVFRCRGGWGWGGVRVKCAPSVTEAEPLLTENSLSHHGYPSNSTAPSLGSSTYYTLYTRINNHKKETDPLRINLFAFFSVSLRDILPNIELICTIPVVCSLLPQVQSCPCYRLKPLNMYLYTIYSLSLQTPHPRHTKATKVTDCLYT